MPNACGEDATRICYGDPSGQSQNLDPDDVAYAAAQVRYIGQSNTGSAALWTMPRSVDCEEWTVPLPDGPGPVIVLTKHITPRYNSSVLWEDIATTIDGGENPSDSDLKSSLLGACGKNGGQVGVKIDSSNPAYSTGDFKAGTLHAGGIVIKIVRNSTWTG